MTTLRLVMNSLVHYWRTNLAVFFGVVAGTAVIGGALIVGDSVRGSLQQMTYDRLGEVDHVLTGPRFFRQDLTKSLADDPTFRERFDEPAPALVLTGGLVYTKKTEPGSVNPGNQQDATNTTRRVGKVNVYGIDERFWKWTAHGDIAAPTDDEVVLSQRTATQLGVTGGEAITMWIELPAAIPRDSLLGNRDNATVEVPLTVKAVVADTVNVARFNLNPNQQLPLNAFVALPSLQQRLGLQERRIRNVKAKRIDTKPGRINTLFFHAKDAEEGDKQPAETAASELTSLVKKHITLDDLYLRVTKIKPRNANREYLSLESEQQVLAEEYGKAGIAAAKSLKLQFSPVLVYLANELLDRKLANVLETQPVSIGAAATLATLQKSAGTGNDLGWYSRYSIIAGVEFATLDRPPFGPFEYDGPPPEKLGRREIVLNRWLADDLKVNVGDTVRAKYHVVGAHVFDENGRLPEVDVEFTVKGITKLNDTPADDRGFTPAVEGITDVDSFDDWKKPFPMKPITERDDYYWDRFRATPKAFVSLATAQELWRSRYGDLTSVRVAKPPGKSLDDSAAAFTTAILSELKPELTGLIVRPVKWNGLQAASGTTDFSALFLSFSFFLILSATILVGMLFRLGVERRGTNIGLLNAVGFAPKRVRRMFLTEGLIVVVAGGLVGAAAAWGYASLMVYGLKNWWIGAIGTRFLDVYVTPMSLAIGITSALFVAMFAVWWALRYFRKLSTRELLAGATEVSLTSALQQRRSRIAKLTAMSTGVVAAGLLGAVMAGLVPSAEAFGGFSWKVVAFFLVGFSLLICGMSGLSWWLDSDRSAAVHGRGLAGTGRLGLRNAARHRQRSVMTVALIASATFVIVAVAAGRRNPAVEVPDKASGNGGFTLVAESSTPILHDLNTVAGRRKLDLDLREKATQAETRANEAARLAGQAKNPAETERLKNAAQQEREQVETLRRQASLLDVMKVVSFRVKPGEDASCLNIYQTRVPTILGVPPAMIERGGFKFIEAKTENPWTLLDEKLDPQDGVPVYPVVGDMNTLQYSLHKGVGDTVAVPNDESPRYRLKIVGMLDGSVFQGVLLLSESNFQTLYPEQSGYQYFLVEVSPHQAEELQSVLETGLGTYGFDTERVAVRLADFLAVQNTYLSTFQTLGGLGLLLGTLGLATVMLRNVLERRAELALLRAVGFRNSGLSWLIIVENTFLLVWGLLVGTVSALLAMTPHLRSTGADVPWQEVSWILLGVFIVGMVAALFAVRAAVRTPIVATLRAE